MSEMIYILLPVYNRRDVTLRFIECLKVQTYQNFHLILIDDGSSDGTADMVRENISSLTLITGKGDWWWAGSLQHGYNWLKRQNTSGSELVLIINDDTEFETDFLQNAINVMSKREHSLMLAWSYCRKSGQLLDSGIHVDWGKLSFEQASKSEEINCLSTRGLFMRLSDFLAMDGFHPFCLPHYTSDYEFTIRAHRMGMQLCSDATCWLKNDQSTTGFRDIDVKSISNVLGKIFSKKSTENPFMWSMFIVLSCPWKYITVNLIRVWWNFLGTIYQSIRLFFVGSKYKYRP